MTTALLLVDIQPDFMPGGPLAVPGGNEVVEVANKLIPKYDLVVLTQDWHPANHGSFASQHEGVAPFEEIELDGLKQVAWPDHCVQGTAGAEIHSDLHYNKLGTSIFRKGLDPHVDSYSGFFDNAKRGNTGLGDFLKNREVDTVHVMGLATDYCVKFTVLDALELGFDVVLHTEGCRGLTEESSKAAIEEMIEKGAKVI